MRIKFGYEDFNAEGHTGCFLSMGLYLKEEVRKGVYWIYLAQDRV
jgi:hypothetical protein